uniref:uncharacterized protein LOC120953751 n=1 Tax=Anopheles coluzzii TaxID=1518534 RepID=UPI0020FFD4D2|nr:uncharacterized protein LOC120953751 [Anopheles coluzzii]
MCNKRVVALIFILEATITLVAANADTSLESRRHSSPYPYAWRWWIAHSVLLIIKGGFWLTVFIIVVLFKAFPAKQSCCSGPIILDEPTFDHHLHHDLSPTGWGRQADRGLSAADLQRYWKDRLEASVNHLLQI